MENINFKENPVYQSQQTLVMFLKQYKYYFVPINPYTNSMFYCIIEYPDNSINARITKFFHKNKECVLPFRLVINACSCAKIDVDEMPFVFTQEDVQHIINDIPENYIGEKEL